MKRIQIFSLKFLIATILISTWSNVCAQPENRWVRYFDSGQILDKFIDVFNQRDGSFAMCGLSRVGNNQYGFWLVNADENGNELTQRVYTDGLQGNFSCRAFSVIQADDGGYLIGGRAPLDGALKFTLLKINSDLEQEWWREYGLGASGQCDAVIETKAGQFVGAGYQITNQGSAHAYIVMTDDEGNVIWEVSFEDEDRIYTILELEGGLTICRIHRRCRK